MHHITNGGDAAPDHPGTGLMSSSPNPTRIKISSRIKIKSRIVVLESKCGDAMRILARVLPCRKAAAGVPLDWPPFGLRDGIMTRQARK